MNYAPPLHAGPGTPSRVAFGVVAALGAALLLGVLAVFAEAQTLIVAASLIGSLFVMLDYRVGVVVLILLLPLSATTVFPHSMAGITGLNPLNLLLLITLLSLLLHGQPSGGWARFAPRPLVWLYVVPVLLAGLFGSTQAEVPPSFFNLIDEVPFDDAGGYLRDFVLKPMNLVLMAMMLGAAVARSKQPERFLIPILTSIWVMSALAVVYFRLSGAGLADIAGAGARGFLSALGVHANDLGRYYTSAYALTLFTAAATPNGKLRIGALMTIGLTAAALMLTFSRAAFLGFALVTVAFLLSQRKLVAVLAGCALVAALAWFAPGEVYERATMGWGTGDINTVSAGRVDDIWRPLLPEALDSPIWGHGLSSTIWSDAVRHGIVEPVGHPHNAYLATLLDMGVVGLLLLGAYIAHVWKCLRRLATDATVSPTLRGFFAGGAVALAVFLIQGFSGSRLSPTHEQFYLWLVIGMMYGQLARTAAGDKPC